jgi:hypothetical protein
LESCRVGDSVAFAVLEKTNLDKPAARCAPTMAATGSRAGRGEFGTPTIRQGLESLVTADAYRQLRQLRGKQKFTIDLKRLRRH